jgi:hypothetical protein
MLGGGKVMSSMADDYKKKLPVKTVISPMELAGYFTLLAVLAITLFHALFVLFRRVSAARKTRLARDLRVLLYASIASIPPAAARVVENVCFAFDRNSTHDPVTGQFSFVFFSFAMQLTATLAILGGGWLTVDIKVSAKCMDGRVNYQPIRQIGH